MLSGDQRMSDKERIVKIVADSPWTAVCKFCRQPVLWARTFTSARWILFDGDVQSIKERDGARYFPTSAIHWTHCVDRHPRESERAETRGQRARA